MSRRPGIGQGYLDTHAAWHKDGKRYYTQVNGQKGVLPRYYKDKLFTEAERARYAAESLVDSDIKYVKEIAELAEFHSDPCAYYDHRHAYNHDVKFVGDKSKF